jgi:large subunit ribosomal protein L17
MRHRKSGRHLSRTSAHRLAMWRNMVTSLLEHERVETTEAKAKELRRQAERTITIAKRLGDLLAKPEGDRTPRENDRYAHAMREAAKMIRTREVLQKLFSDIAPRAMARPGGYTRIVKVGRRLGDAAPLALVELVDRTPPVAAEA